MPSYDFYCSECKDAVTVAISIDKELMVPGCAKCKQPMVRNFGVQSIQFKGPGFYSNEKK